MGLKCLDVGLITTFKTHTDTCFYVCIYLGEIGYHCAIFVSVESCELLEMSAIFVCVESCQIFEMKDFDCVREMSAGWYLLGICPLFD